MRYQIKHRDKSRWIKVARSQPAPAPAPAAPPVPSVVIERVERNKLYDRSALFCAAYVSRVGPPRFSYKKPDDGVARRPSWTPEPDRYGITFWRGSISKSHVLTFYLERGMPLPSHLPVLDEIEALRQLKDALACTPALFPAAVQMYSAALRDVARGAERWWKPEEGKSGFRDLPGIRRRVRERHWLCPVVWCLAQTAQNL